MEQLQILQVCSVTDSDPVGLIKQAYCMFHDKGVGFFPRKLCVMCCYCILFNVK